ncbi:MAG: ferric reductase-like transmembrane domain-containing protein [Nocardioidaceae bacterium]
MTLTESLWYLGRGTGIVALVMFTVTMVLGITTRSGRRVAGLDRFGVAELHKTASLAGTALILVHVGTLLFDPYAQLRLIDLVLPFAGSYRPVWQGLGTAAVDVLLVIVATSLLRHRIGPRVFRAVHWAAYAMWPLALAHGLGNGTDAATLWFRSIALACALAVTGAVTWRLSAGYAERGMRRIPRTPAHTQHQEVVSR